MIFFNRLLTLLLLISPLVAFAADLGDISRTTTKLLGEVSNLGDVVFFITGGAFLISAAIKFQQYKRSPQFTPISRPIAELIAAIVLIALPFIFAATVDNALFKKAPRSHPYTNATPQG